jgi:hypothetical protein
MGMNKIFLFVVLFALSCKNDEVKYYNHAKWQIPGDYNYSSLKVKESLFFQLSDTTIDALGNFFNNYDIWRFDENGNLIYRKFSSSSDSFQIISEMTYDKNGYQDHAYYINKDSAGGEKQVGRTISILQKDGRFLEKSYYTLGKPKFSLISFLENGSAEKSEFVEDTNNLDSVMKTQITYYKDNLIQRIEVTAGNQKQEQFFLFKRKFP